MRDVLISCMALQQVPAWLPWPNGAPALIEWAGQPPDTSTGHPTWGAVAAPLRDQHGAMLPALFRAYRAFPGFDLADDVRIAVVGFSAGSNSGLRELLRNPLDRARISFVGAIDGLHPNLSPVPPTPADLMRDPLRRYADWGAEEGGIQAMATDAALDAGPEVVATCSGVAAPSATNADTRTALSDLEWQVFSAVQAAGQRLVQPAVPTPFPEQQQSPHLHAGEAYPVPFTRSGCRRFVALYYTGNQARDHVLQARVVAPDVLRAFLIPFWASSSGGASVVVDRPGISTDPGDLVEVAAAPRVSPSMGWLPPALAAAAMLGASFAA